MCGLMGRLEHACLYEQVCVCTASGLASSLSHAVRCT